MDMASCSHKKPGPRLQENTDEKMLIQAIRHLDTLDKDIVSFSTRLRELYCCGFPELVDILSDNCEYAKVVSCIKDKSKLSDDHISDLTCILGDEVKAKEIIKASKTSIGMNLSEIDLNNIRLLAQKLENLFVHKQKVFTYLGLKMRRIAPNLSRLVGEEVGAQLISHSGSLLDLAKLPSSTLQNFGTGNVLHRASLIRRATNKSKMARYLAKKCSIASRIDCFAEEKWTKTLNGEILHAQAEDQLQFYNKGQTISVRSGNLDRLIRNYNEWKKICSIKKEGVESMPEYKNLMRTIEPKLLYEATTGWSEREIQLSVDCITRRINNLKNEADALAKMDADEIKNKLAKELAKVGKIFLECRKDWDNIQPMIEDEPLFRPILVVVSWGFGFDTMQSISEFGKQLGICVRVERPTREPKQVIWEFEESIPTLSFSP